MVLVFLFMALNVNLCNTCNTFGDNNFKVSKESGYCTCTFNFISNSLVDLRSYVTLVF